MTPEGRIKAKLKKELDKLPCLYQFRPVQNGMGAPSLDVLVCAGGWFIAIETKAPGKWYTPRQEETKKAIEKAHGLVYLVDDDVSLAAAIKVISQCCSLANEIRTNEHNPVEPH
jgi:hypothetical protein